MKSKMVKFEITYILFFTTLFLCITEATYMYSTFGEFTNCLKEKLIPFRSAFFIRQKKMSQKADGILLKILLSWIASEFTTSQICVYVYYKKMSKIKGGNKTILLSRSLLTYFAQK